MQLTPRYDGPSVIDISAFVVDPSAAVIRQRNRLTEIFSELSAQEWAAPSRCAGWSVQDVAHHLVTVNRFWQVSIGAGMQDEPTRYLASFDPVTVPAALVESARGELPATTVEKLRVGNVELATVLNSMTQSDWLKSAEAPPGHISMGAVCAHALWDSWIHERDVLIPLGREQQIEPDEVATALIYAAALGPAICLNAGESASGSLSVDASHPDVAFTVEVSQQVRIRPGVATHPTALIMGAAVDLVEGFSARGPLPLVADDQQWLVGGLRRAFDESG
jgi:uncharacterized protein (TIGR03083 family)